MSRIINGGFRPKVGDTIKTSKGPRVVAPLEPWYDTIPLDKKPKKRKVKA